MDRKAKRNKEVHTAKVYLLAGTQVQDLMTGAFVCHREATGLKDWHLKEKEY